MMKIERLTSIPSDDPWYVRTEKEVQEMAHYDFEMAWASIYHTFEDNAFDYRGKPFAVGDALIYNGVEYVEVPF